MKSNAGTGRPTYQYVEANITRVMRSKHQSTEYFGTWKYLKCVNCEAEVKSPNRLDRENQRNECKANQNQNYEHTGT